jgi:phosphoglycolate phosphatase-like HAD superfamily hydrolase
MLDSASPGQAQILHHDRPRGPFRCVVFDFDGTLSLLRADWQGLMIPLMVRVLAATGTAECASDLTARMTDLVTRTTGRPTIVQMQALADEVRRRGRSAADPLVYLAQYQDQLLARTAARIAKLKSGAAASDEMLVPGTRRLVERLTQQGQHLVIASGTDLADVKKETAILGLAEHFGERIHGPVNNDPSFTKHRVLEMLIAEHQWRGEELVCIGDGTAEMQAARAVGALAIGVASDEVHRSGSLNPLKYEHLAAAGAHAIVPDYQDLPFVLKLLTPEP